MVPYVTSGSSLSPVMIHDHGETTGFDTLEARVQDMRIPCCRGCHALCSTLPQSYNYPPNKQVSLIYSSLPRPTPPTPVPA